MDDRSVKLPAASGSAADESVPPRARNAQATRQAILCAARRRFGQDSYDQVGCRDIGAEAGVDGSLVNRYFGSKEDLFAAVLDAVGKDPVDILSGEASDFGRRAAEALLFGEADAQGGLEFVNLAMRSAASPVAQKVVRRHLQEHFLGPFGAWVCGEDAEIRACLAASVLIGVAVMRGVLCRERMGGDNAQIAAERLARLLQALADA